jgi:hypothetical protein
MDTSTVALTVFAKGLRVTRDNEEFQRVWPSDSDPLTLTYPVQHQLSEWDGWSDLIADLYRMRPSRIEAQQCLLIGHDAFTFIAARRMRDAHQRPTVIIVAATIAATWGDEARVVASIGHSAATAQAVAQAEAERFEADPLGYAAALRLKRATIAVPAVVNSELSYWAPLVREISRYRGVVGAATPAMAPLGANIVIGTEHEARVVARNHAVAGYYLPQLERIVPLGDGLTPWSQGRDGGIDGYTPDQAQVFDHHVPPWDGVPPDRLERQDLVDVAFGIEAAMREQNAIAARRLRMEEALADRRLSIAQRALDVLATGITILERWTRGKKS